MSRSEGSLVANRIPPPDPRRSVRRRGALGLPGPLARHAGRDLRLYRTRDAGPCIYAFSPARLAYVAFRALGLQDRHMPVAAATCVEIACVAALFATITIFGDSPYAVAVPILFPRLPVRAGWGRGLVSSLLRLAVARRLGTLSYSVYMFARRLWASGMRIVRALDERYAFLGFSETRPGQLEFFGSTPARPSSSHGLLAIVLLSSAADPTGYLERPARDAMRRWIEPGNAARPRPPHPRTGAIAISDTRAMPTA